MSKSDKLANKLIEFVDLVSDPNRNESFYQSVSDSGYSVTPTQVHIIGIISKYGDEANNSFIAAQLGLTRPAVTAAIRRLSEMNLINQVPSKTDKRKKHFEITEDAQKLATFRSNMNDKVKETYSVEVEKLGKKERKGVIKLLDGLTQAYKNGSPL